MKTLSTYLFFLCIATASFAQEDKPIKDSLYSEALEEKRHFEIILPEKYDPNTADKYDVIYVTDGGGNKDLMQACMQFMQQERKAPPVIMVIVFNVDRNRDFLPSHNKNVPTSGGASKFLKFFKTELMPHIDKNYATSKMDILYGHSFGGVFSMTALMEEPDLFDAYIAVDPSFWWDEQLLVRTAAEKLDAEKTKGKILFYTGREGQGYIGMGLNTMDSILQKLDNELDWKSVAYPNETHGSVRYKSIYDAMQYIYEGFGTSVVSMHPMGGIMLKDQPIMVFCTTEHPNIRFTTDGSEPTADSPKLEKRMLVLEQPTVLKTRAFSKRGGGTTTTNEYKLGEAMPTVNKPKKATKGSLNYTYYEGKWDSLPDFSQLKKADKGVMENSFDFSILPKKENYACVFEGYLHIEEEGYYAFGITSDDGSKMYLNEEMIINNDGLHAMEEPVSYILPLKEGFYPIKIEFFQQGGGQGIEIFYLKPNTQEPLPLSFDLLYSKKTKVGK
ncbi:alpha/beta hydrolase-fold protein [Flammeovirgaceae bacterium SG7u.111]|nr:alpha/beta hydrolase-fold protein [Flammeovirgaceae bacterium SG7u.132]WPO37217.1 alpha/beta hydrolase-fold protein [Flammeovirgaceae bacterium SG7u.111]